jgi:anti-sigma regulatory factor (Ser/Thr protein kinase)
MCRRSHVDSVRHIGLIAREADLRLLRRELGDWARAAGLTLDQAEDLTLACYEVCTNVVEHAYPSDMDGTFDVEAVVRTACIDVTIRDRGTWQAPAHDGSTAAFRGRGLLLARAFADHVSVETTSGGTTVLLRWNLPGEPTDPAAPL